MHAHQRDCVRPGRRARVNGYHRVPMAIILIADGTLKVVGESDDILARIKMIDRDCADITRRRLLEYEGIMTRADRYIVIRPNFRPL